MYRFQILTFRFACLLSVMLLAGCPSLPYEQASDLDHNAPAWINHQQQLKSLVHYQAQGTFGYISPQESHSASFNWRQQNKNNYRLLLTSPFGGRLAELNASATVVTLTDNNGKSLSGDNAEMLLYQLTGMHIPLNNLMFWLIGLPGDSQDYVLNQHAQLYQVNYYDNNGAWQVTYKNYHNQYDIPLPWELELKQGQQLIKLKINKWNIGQ